jgi:hypothetical protein
MPKSKSGYTRPYAYQPPEGVKIDIKTQEAYDILKRCALYNSCTIGQWAEANLRYALSGAPYIPQVRLTDTTPATKARSFQISEALMTAIEHKVGETKARQWIATTLLGLAKIELTNQQGERSDPERFGPKATSPRPLFGELQR